MKDWNIVNKPWGPQPKKMLVHQGCLKSSYLYYACGKDSRGWVCLGCSLEPPEEIQFVADLANCDNFVGSIVSKEERLTTATELSVIRGREIEVVVYNEKEDD